VRGTVSADLPSGWTSAPAEFTVDPRGGPASTVVDLTVQAPADGEGGQLTVPITATAGAVSAGTTATLLHFGAWPSGTTAAASSFHAPNVYNGETRTYGPDNAIDGNLATFWNDDTPGAFPDTLTISAPSPVHLSGVGFASIVDGVPTDFSVQTFDGSQWTTRATVTGNSDLYRWIPFAQPVDTTQVRVVVTGSQAQNGNFTRIVELTP
jgi:F5/8 type C domain